MLTNLPEKAGVRAKVKGAKTETAPKAKAKGKPRGQEVKVKAAGNGRNEDLPLQANRISHPAVPTSRENAKKVLIAITGILQSASIGRRASTQKIVAPSFTAKSQISELLALHLLQQPLRLKVKPRQNLNLRRNLKVL